MKPAHFAVTPVAALVLIAAACGNASHRGDDSVDANPLPGLTSITITPADQTLQVSSGQPASLAYSAMGTFADGHTADITAQTVFSLENASLGSFNSAQLVTTDSHGGKTHVIGAAGGVNGTANLLIKLNQAWNDPGSKNLPPDPGGKFGGGADPKRAPTLVYPNDGVVVPPNLGRLEFHFYPGTNNTLFELRFQSELIDVKVYLRCTTPMNNGCIYQPDANVWQWIAQSDVGGAPVTWSLRGTDDNGSAVGSSASQSISFAQDSLSGGIYYWTTTTKSIMRYDFASTTQTQAEVYLTSDTDLSGKLCIGCHALSHDGSKLVAEAEGQNGGKTLLLDVATKTPKSTFGNVATPYHKSNFESWSPDGSQYVGVWADGGSDDYNLMLFDGNNNMKTASIAVNGSADHPTDHPDWSPDGDHIAFVRVGTPNTLQKMYNGGIWTVARSGGAWSAAKELVPTVAGKNRYYPAYSPDGARVVFNESKCASGSTGEDCDADTDPTATLWMVPAGGGTPVQLTNADKPGVADNGNKTLTDSFPKWNPFVWKRSASGGRLAWITFSSKRQYGLRNPPNGTLLWMAAVDLDAPAGSDPSSVAFALPFQDYTTSNHIAQWTTKVVVVQ